MGTVCGHPSCRVKENKVRECPNLYRTDTIYGGVAWPGASELRKGEEGAEVWYNQLCVA